MNCCERSGPSLNNLILIRASHVTQFLAGVTIEWLSEGESGTFLLCMFRDQKGQISGKNRAVKKTRAFYKERSEHCGIAYLTLETLLKSTSLEPVAGNRLVITKQQTSVFTAFTLLFNTLNSKHIVGTDTSAYSHCSDEWCLQNVSEAPCKLYSSLGLQRNVKLSLK